MTAPTHAETDEGFLELLHKIETERFVACASYKERCVRRRISVRMRATGVHTFKDYSNVLDRTPHEWEKLLAALTINVTKFFRDPSAFATLEQVAYPLLRDTFAGPLQVWSAGCSHGHEPYSLAMGLAEVVGADRFRIEATDIDRESLATASAGRYTDLALDGVSSDRRQRWFSDEGSTTVAPSLRSRVRVLRHDLLRDVMPEERFHLITCRNVIIYFSRDAQATLFDQLHNSLIPGGLLMLGKVETLVGPARDKFQSLSLRERLFRRPPE